MNHSSIEFGLHDRFVRIHKLQLLVDSQTKERERLTKMIKQHKHELEELIRTAPLG